MKKNKIINLGCRLNIYEGELIKTLIEKSDLSNLTIINSCAVTQDAEKKVRDALMDVGFGVYRRRNNAYGRKSSSWNAVAWMGALR